MGEMRMFTAVAVQPSAFSLGKVETPYCASSTGAYGECSSELQNKQEKCWWKTGEHPPIHLLLSPVWMVLVCDEEGFCTVVLWQLIVFVNVSVLLKSTSQRHWPGEQVQQWLCEDKNWLCKLFPSLTILAESGGGGCIMFLHDSCVGGGGCEWVSCWLFWCTGRDSVFVFSSLCFLSRPMVLTHFRRMYSPPWLMV